MARESNEVAEIGLIIESDSQKIADRYPYDWNETRCVNPDGNYDSERLEINEFVDLGELTGNDKLKGYDLLELQYIKDADGRFRLKSIACMDADGNIYIHFIGTGDGNWDYNKAAYDTEPSEIQTESAAFAAHIIGTYAKDGKDVYLTGHSQGGNTAQYATMVIDPSLGERITITITANGPGFSEDVYNNELHQHGDPYFNYQRKKIYAYNGNTDYVNPLGQKQLVLDNQKYMIKTDKIGYGKGEDESDFVKWHCANYMLDENGKMREYLPYDEAIEKGWPEPIQLFVISLNGWLVENLPQQDQILIAMLVMAIVETITNGKDGVVDGDFNTIIIKAIERYIPGSEAVIERLELMVLEKGFTSWKDIADYILEDPLRNVLELFSYVLGDKEGLMGLMKMAGFIAALVLVIPVLLKLLGAVVIVAAKVLLVIAAVFAALVILKLVAEFLVKMWDVITDTIEATIEYINKLAQDIYAYVRARVEQAIEVAMDAAKYVVESTKQFIKDTYMNLERFANYVQDCLENIYAGIKSVSDRVSKTVGGYIESGVRLQMALLQDCTDRMNALAARVQRVDQRLDQLYYRLLASEIMQGENVFVSLITLFNLAWADFNVDEGNRIRRMANNLSEVNNNYKQLEQWAMGLQLGG